MRSILGAWAALILLTGVSACGLTGDLKRPGPLVGNPSGVDPASLPDTENRNLPELPDRPSDGSDEAAGDELLGGPGSR